MSVKVEKIRQEGNLFVFKVTVSEVNSSATFEVAVEKGYSEKLGYNSPEKLIEKSFEFLLAREPKELILSEFNVREISRYFPEFEEKI